MEFSEVVGTQFAFHGIAVGFVIILAVLVFIFGFRTAEEPPFDKLTNSADDRKPAGKKRKVKDKKLQTNGHATSVGSERADAKQKSNESVGKSASKSPNKSKEEKRDVQKSPAKDTGKASNQVKKQQKTEVEVTKTALKENKNIKENKNELKPSKKQEQSSGGKDSKRNKGKENVDVQVQNKKNLEKSKSKKIEEKPQDFDEGEWEQASYRKDKKKKVAGEADKPADKKDTPTKKKKVAKVAAPEPVPETIVASEPEEKPESVDKKATKKDSAKKDKPKSIEIAEEVVATPSDAGDSENDSKSAPKKKKKKSAKEGADIAVAVEKIAPTEVIEKPVPKVTAATQPSAEKAAPEPATTLEENIAFDELADACPEKWKEPKTSKKSNSRKKVRKE